MEMPAQFETLHSDIMHKMFVCMLQSAKLGTLKTLNMPACFVPSNTKGREAT